MLNIYLGAVCAVMLVDIAYSYIMMFANNKNQLKLIGAIAFVGAGVVLRVFGLFPGMNKNEKPADGGAMISEEAVNRFETFLCSGKTLLCISAVFVVLGVSNHNLAEIRQAAEILQAHGLKLSAVQNHYSLINRSSASWRS